MTAKPEPKFLHFQDIVDQARQSIQLYCPEWTDYNLSDPGVTLIELFAFMTTQLNYRLNRVPERNYEKFLDMVGARPAPPRPAKTELTFYLSTPFPLVRADNTLDYDIETEIPKNTRVATRRVTGEETEIIFVTPQNGHLIKPPILTELHRDLEGRDLDRAFRENYVSPMSLSTGLKVHNPVLNFKPFQDNPKEDDAFYLGFDAKRPLAGYVLRLEVECAEHEGLGVTQKDPPLIWEASVGDQEEWRVIPVNPLEDDTTLGLTRKGTITLHLPVDIKPVKLKGDLEAYWVRCRLKPRKSQAIYTKTPHLTGLQVFVTGISLPAIHSDPVTEPEILGLSSGEPNQQFSLRRHPVLPLDSEWGEQVEVEEEQPDRYGKPGFALWERRQDFSQSTKFDRHYILDSAEGRILFGPAVRQPDGEVRQYGAVPPLGSRVRVTGYRTGGGSQGNLRAGRLRVLKKPISYIVDVTNRVEAAGGRDAESVDAAKLQAQAEIKSLNRAVTALDYEWLCRRVSNQVARAKCLEPGHAQVDPGWVKLLVVPKPRPRATYRPAQEAQAVELLTETEVIQQLLQLRLDRAFKNSLRADLDEYRMLGVNLEIAEPRYYGVKISARIVPDVYSDALAVKRTVIKSLVDFLDPVGRLPSEGESPSVLPYPAPEPPGAWPFGQSLYISDVYATIQAVAGVKHITGVKMACCPLNLADLAEKVEQGEKLTLEWDELEAKEEIEVEPDGLICLVDVSEIKEG